MRRAAFGTRRFGPVRALRLVLLAMVALGLAPGTFVRAPNQNRTDPAEVQVTPRLNVRELKVAFRSKGSRN